MKGNRKILISAEESKWLPIKSADKNYFDWAIKNVTAFAIALFLIV